MRDKGLSEGLIERVIEALQETVGKVRIGKKEGENFWTGRGLRQGCPLSPLLFSILLSDLEERLAKNGKGGVELGVRRVFHLAYADDIVLVADDENGMRLLIRVFEQYVREKDLVVNVGKTKMMVFRKRKGRNECERTWRMNGEVVEEVKEFCYLGYWLTEDGSDRMQIKRRVKLAGRVMGQVWAIGKRRFKDDWKKRIWMFDVLVWSMLSYGVEIWGWEGSNTIEAMHERFLKWVFGLSRSCPGYMLREELGRKRLRESMLKRVWNFENKTKMRGGNKLVEVCLAEIERRERAGEGGMSKWEKRRANVRREWEMIGVNEWKTIQDRIEQKEKEWRWEKIMRSCSNRWYKICRETEEVPEYLLSVKREEKWQRMMRFRMGEGMREAWYWREEECKLCRICGNEVETCEHVLDRCARDDECDESRGVIERVKHILEESGRGLRWLKELETRRGIWGGNERDSQAE